MLEARPNVTDSFPSRNNAAEQTRGPALLITNVVLLSIALIVVVLRVYTRIYMQRWFGSDDIFIIVAFFLTAGFTTVVLIGEECFGWSKHIWDIQFSVIKDALVFAFIAKLLFGIACFCIRASLLCLYQRLVHNVASPWFRAATYAVWVYVVLVLVVGTSVVVLGCRPTSAYWTFPRPSSAKCMGYGSQGVIVGSSHCVADLLVTLLPLPIVLSLRLPTRVRIATLVLLQLGIVVTVAGALRTYFSWRAYNAGHDPTWLSYPVWFVAAVEVNLGMICACIPPCRPLFVKVFVPTLANIGSRLTSVKPSLPPTEPSSSEIVLQSTRAGLPGEYYAFTELQDCPIPRGPGKEDEFDGSRSDTTSNEIFIHPPDPAAIA